MDRMASSSRERQVEPTEASDRGGDAQRPLKARAPRLPTDVWLGVAAHCAVDALLTLETTGKDLRDLTRAKTFDSVWRQRFSTAAPELATVLLEGTGRDLCRMYESRWRHARAAGSYAAGSLGVNRWHGVPSSPLNPPRVILVVDDVAGELVWGGDDGYGEKVGWALLWVPERTVHSREYTRFELTSVVTSCYVVDDQRIVELWKNYFEPSEVQVYDDDGEGIVLETEDHGSVEIFGFRGEAIPQRRFELYATSSANCRNNEERNREMKDRGDVDLCTSMCDLRFTTSGFDLDEDGIQRYQLLDASLRIGVRDDLDTFEDLASFSSLLKCALSPESSLMRVP